jgi:hypothetical protein
MLGTDQKFAGLDSNNPSVKSNADDSYTMCFGPKAPKGHEGNWIQTMAGKSLNVLLRLYGPMQPWFVVTPDDLPLLEKKLVDLEQFNQAVERLRSRPEAVSWLQKIRGLQRELILMNGTRLSRAEALLESLQQNQRRH